MLESQAWMFSDDGITDEDIENKSFVSLLINMDGKILLMRFWKKD